MSLDANSFSEFDTGCGFVVKIAISVERKEAGPHLPPPPPPPPPVIGAFPLIEPIGDWATSSLATTAYTPALVAPVFDVRDYGANPLGLSNSTQAFRDALAAHEAAGGGTVYVPAGIYNLWPDDVYEEPTQTQHPAIFLHHSGIVIEGDGPTKTILNFRAPGGRDPAEDQLYRGFGFTTLYAPGPIDGITIRGLRATGNAPLTAQAGAYSGVGSLTGWDTTHKFLAIFGTITGVVVEDCELDNWRGEIIYSGGGLELGTATIRRCLIRSANASAISMGGDILIEDCELYANLNATECFCGGGTSKMIVRRCIIDPKRGWPEGFNLGTFGVVYHGYKANSLLVEGCSFGDSLYAGVLIAEFGSNVTIQNNTFTDTQGIYQIYQGQYEPYPDAVPPSELNKFENWVIQGNTFTAATRDVSEAIYGYVLPGENWLIDGNTVTGTGSYNYNVFLSNNGATGSFIVSNNTIEDAQPSLAGGNRAVWIDNVVTGDFADGATVFDYGSAAGYIELTPKWPKLNFIAVPTPTKLARVESAHFATLPVGFEIEIRRTGGGAEFSGPEIQPDAAWNTLTRGYIIYAGGVLKLVKGAISGKFDFVSYTPNTEWLRTLTQTATSGQTSAADIGMIGQLEVNLSPTVAHTFSTFSGVAIGETITLNLNSNVTLDHVPGVLEMSTGVDYVSAGTVALSATRAADGTLEVTIP